MVEPFWLKFGPTFNFRVPRLCLEIRILWAEEFLLDCWCFRSQSKFGSVVAFDFDKHASTFLAVNRCEVKEVFECESSITSKLQAVMIVSHFVLQDATRDILERRVLSAVEHAELRGRVRGARDVDFF